MASRMGIHTYIPKYFYGGQKLHKYVSSLRVRGTSLLTCSYIGELRNGRKSKCENAPFIVLTLILRRFLSWIFFLNSTRIYSRWDEFDVTRN